MSSPSPSLLAEVRRDLAQYAPFQQMPVEALDWLASRLTVSYHPQDSLLLSPQQPAAQLFIVKRGIVRSEDGEQRIALHELHAGEMFPLGALMGRRAAQSAFRAAEDCFCYQLPLAAFDELLQRSAPFRDFCTRRLAHLLELSRQRMQTAYAAQAAQQALDVPLADVCHSPVTCTPDTPLRTVLQTLRTRRIGSMVVADAERRALGIFTLHDLLRVSVDGMSLDVAVSAVMSRGLVSLPSGARAYEAALEMASHGVRHLLVIDQGRLNGVVSERDLFRLQRVSLNQLSRAIADADSLVELQQAARDIRALAGNMVAQGMAPEQLTRIVATLNDRVAQRILALREPELEGLGVDICWVAFGSEGRQEQTIATDQDNGLIFSVPPGRDADAIRSALLPWTRRVNDDLAACGYPLCRGNVMASNPACCLSLDEWRAVFQRWIHAGTPENLLNATIYFDMRPLYGELWFAYEVREWVITMAAGTASFLYLLAQNALATKPPLGVWRDFVTEPVAGEDSLDLKRYGVTLFVDAARVLSLAQGVDVCNTAERLRLAGARLRLPEDTVSAWIEAFHFLQTLRLHNQQQTDAGNRVNPARLNELDRRILKEALRQARKLQTQLAMFYPPA